MTTDIQNMLSTSRKCHIEENDDFLDQNLNFFSEQKIGLLEWEKEDDNIYRPSMIESMLGMSKSSLKCDYFEKEGEINLKKKSFFKSSFETTCNSNILSTSTYNPLSSTPSMQEIVSLPFYKRSSIQNFKIFNNFGKVEFLKSVDLSEFDYLEEIAYLQKGHLMLVP